MQALIVIVLRVLLADMIVPFLSAIPYKGYSHKTTVMSALGAKGRALLFVPLLLGIVQLRSNKAVVGSVSVAAFVLSVVFFVIFVMSDKPTFRNTVLSWTGLWQRASMYAMYLPLIVFTIYLL